MNREQGVAYLRSVGIEPDMRQEGRLIKFATFPVVDRAYAAELGEICDALKDYFIANVTTYPYSSSLTQITYSPILSDIYPALKDLKVSHARSEKAVFIAARLDEGTWTSSDSAQRRAISVSRLVAALPQIRGSWLSQVDRESLVNLFDSFLTAVTLPSPTAKDGET